MKRTSALLLLAAVAWADPHARLAARPEPANLYEEAVRVAALPPQSGALYTGPDLPATMPVVALPPVARFRAHFGQSREQPRLLSESESGAILKLFVGSQALVFYGAVILVGLLFIRAQFKLDHASGSRPTRAS